LNQFYQQCPGIVAAVTGISIIGEINFLLAGDQHQRRASKESDQTSHSSCLDDAVLVRSNYR
jgi:hypothetical protein